jgi:hypothetical protein
VGGRAHRFAAGIADCVVKNLFETWPVGAFLTSLQDAILMNHTAQITTAAIDYGPTRLLSFRNPKETETDSECQ